MSAAPAGGGDARTPVGVLLMAYGTPARPEDVEEFYTDIRRGRPPSSEQLFELQERYAAVGGVSQLSARTAEQVDGVQAALDRLQPGEFSCRYGAKHSSPKIEDAIGTMAEDGLTRLVALVLAPHYSAGSVGEYLGRVRRAAESSGIEARLIEDWHDDPVLVELLAERVRRAMDELRREGAPGQVELLVTAHSLPMRVVESGDGYDARLAETASLVAALVPTEHYRVCWQSAGRTPEPWLGPDVLEVLRELAAERDSGGSGASRAPRGVVVCPAGFTSDHLEVNYDLDIEARALAEELGLGFARTASLNADERLCDALAERIAAAALAWRHL